MQKSFRKIKVQNFSQSGFAEVGALAYEPASLSFPGGISFAFPPICVLNSVSGESEAVSPPIHIRNSVSGEFEPEIPPD